MTADAMRKELLARLQTAASLELTTIPAYLTALFSVKRTANRQAAENIRGVAMEEMLHLVLVANVMSSIGGRVRVTGDFVPYYPVDLSFKGKAFADRKFKVHLAPFSEETVRTFMAIEQPREPQMKAMAFELKKIEVPEPTIGGFYDSIIALLVQLEHEIGSGGLFTGDPAKQIGEDFYWSAGGKPILVKDLASAIAALNIVIQQGEGTTRSLNDGDQPHFGQPFEVAHFYRFKEILCKRRYAPGDDPRGDPSGAEVSVDYSAVFPIKIDPQQSDYQANAALASMNLAFNRQYSLMLIQLEEALNGEPKTLYTAIMNGMHNLASLALQMVAVPIAQGAATTGCPSFQWIEP